MYNKSQFLKQEHLRGGLKSQGGPCAINGK
jgi:hypothetical protein